MLLDVWMSAPLIKDGQVAEIGEVFCLVLIHNHFVSNCFSFIFQLQVIKRVNKVLLKMSISQGHSYLVIGAQAEVCKLNNIR